MLFFTLFSNIGPINQILTSTGLADTVSQYQKGLENYCIAKVGKELFKKLMDDENK